MKPTKYLQQKKKMRQGKSKKGESKRKVTVKTAVSLFKPKNSHKVLLSAHCLNFASYINILHLDRKATICTTCKWLYGKF